MPPQDVKKGSPTKKMRFSAGCDMDGEKYDTCVSIRSYAMIAPGTGIVCKGCFSLVTDMSQHTNKASGCSLYLAAHHVIYCYQENTWDGFEPDAAIISNMILDETIPLTARDIVAQPCTWNPTEKFQNTGKYGHTVSDKLTETSFHAMYENYLDKHRELRNCVIPDAVSLACQGATSVKNLPLWLSKSYKMICEEYVRNEIKAGRLQRVPRTNGNNGGNNGGNGTSSV